MTRSASRLLWTVATAITIVEGGVSVSAVPEPGTGATFGAGLLAVVALRRRTGSRRPGRGRP